MTTPRKRKQKPKLRDDRKLLFILGVCALLMLAFFIYITA